MKRHRFKRRLFKRKFSAASTRKFHRMQESIWWATAKHAPTRKDEPPEPWFARLLSHRSGFA